MRAALYVRVSTDKQEADNQSLQLRAYCKKQGYTIYEEYRDVISGKENKRPAFDRMFQDAGKLLFDVVVFWDLSRFSRSGTAFTLIQLQRLENLKIGWESYQEQYFRSAGEFKPVLLSIMSTLAKIERDKISERTKAGLQRVRASGKVLGRPKGSKDKKKRRAKGYYDNRNWHGTNKGVSNNLHPKPLEKVIVKDEQTNAPLFNDENEV